MSLDTLLDVIVQAADELGLPRPKSAAGSNDQQTRQLLALVNATGRDIARANAWTALQKLDEITSVAGQDTYALAADFDRLIDDTEWDRSEKWRLHGPLTPQEERLLNESGMAETGVKRFRILGKTMRMWPPPRVAGRVFVYEYISLNWARAADGTEKPQMDADTDTTPWPMDLLVKGVKWKFMAAKGFDADELRADFLNAVEREKGDDSGGGMLNMGGVYDDEAYFGAIVLPAVPESGGGAGSGGGTPDTPAGQYPTDIALSASSVLETAPEDTVIGTFTTTDPDTGDVFSYALRNNAGGRFKIVGDELRVASIPLNAGDGPQAITVRVTDSYNLYLDKSFTISIVDVNAAPTDIALSRTSIAEDAAIGTLVATISAVDPDPNQTFTFTITDDPDSKFTIANGNELRTRAGLDYETKTAHLVTIQATDQGGLTYSEQFTISVTDVVEAAVTYSIAVDAATVNEGQTRVWTITRTGPTLVADEYLRIDVLGTADDSDTTLTSNASITAAMVTGVAFAAGPPGIITFTSGWDGTPIAISREIVADSLTEGTETMGYSIAPANGSSFSIGTASASVTISDTSTAALAAPNFNATVPTISGTLEQGQTLTAVSASGLTGTPIPTSTWQWKRSGVAISGATGQTYVAASADVAAGANALTVEQTATNSQGSASATSAGVTITNPTSVNDYVPSTFRAGVTFPVAGKDFDVGYLGALSSLTKPFVRNGVVFNGGREIVLQNGVVLDGWDFRGYRLTIAPGATVTLKNGVIDSSYYTVHGDSGGPMIFSSGATLNLENFTMDGLKNANQPANSAMTNYAIVSTGSSGGIVNTYRAKIYNIFSDGIVTTGGKHFETCITNIGYDSGTPHTDAVEVIGSQGGEVQFIRCYLDAQSTAEQRANRGGGPGSEWEDAGVKNWQELDGVFNNDILFDECCIAGGYYAIRCWGPSTGGGKRRYVNCWVWSDSYDAGNADKTGDTSNDILAGGGDLSTIQNTRWRKFDGSILTFPDCANADEAATLTVPADVTLSLSSAAAGQITIGLTTGVNTNFVETRYRKRGTSRWSFWATTVDGATISGLDSTATYEVQARAVNTAQGGGVTGNTVSGTQAADGGGAGPDVTAPTITSASSVSTPDGGALSHMLTADEPVTWAIRTATQNALSTDWDEFTLTDDLLTSPARSFAAPTDSNLGNDYVAVIRATDPSGNFSEQTFTQTVTEGGIALAAVGALDSEVGVFASDNTISVAIPAHASGDLLVIPMASGCQGTPATPAGWELTAVSAGGYYHRIWLYSRVADGSEGATVDIAMPDLGSVQNAVMAGRCFVISGNKAASPIEGAVNREDTFPTGTTLAGRSVTTGAGTDRIVFQVFSGKGLFTATPPSGWTKQCDDQIDQGDPTWDRENLFYTVLTKMVGPSTVEGAPTITLSGAVDGSNGDAVVAFAVVPLGS